MTQVVLVNCQGRLVLERHEHLGLGHLSSYLGSLGMDVSIVDGHFEGLTPGRTAELVLALRPSIVGFSIFFNNLADSLETIGLLRQGGYTGHICLGGHHASFLYRRLLERNPHVDSVVVGEGEHTLAELVTRLGRGDGWQDVAGLACRDDRGVVRTPAPRHLLTDLDSLPFPDRSPYVNHRKSVGIADMASSRGCYARCSFCSVSAFYKLGKGPRWRARSPENLVREMENIAATGTRYVHFVDDNFMGLGLLGRERARAFGEEILKRRLDLSFDLDCRPNDVDEEVFAFLKTAGLRQVGIGVESMVPRQLRLYEKRVSIEQNRKAIDILQRLGLEFHVFLVPIEPYVTIEDLLLTMDFMESVGLDHVLDGQILSWLVVLEGTSALEKLRRDGVLWEPGDGSSQGDVAWGHPYVVQDRRVANALPHLHKLYYRYMELQRHLLGTSAANLVFQLFLRQAQAVLKRYKFNMMREVLLECRAGDPGASAARFEKALRRLEVDVRRILEADRKGVFNAFVPREFRLGREALVHPPPEVSSMAEALASQFQA